MKLQPSLWSANSIRVSESKHLILLSDVPDQAGINEFNQVFDLAVKQWCEYFSVPQEKAKDWHLRGMIIGDLPRFKRARLFPSDLPVFPAGFQRGHDTWVYLQPGNYYTRHLLLHEGTHAFMQWFLGGMGAPWYSEGMAELLGVHQWKNGQLKLNFNLTDRKQAEYWGRIKLIIDDREQQNRMSLDDVFGLPNHAFRDVRSYAWSWAACEFFSRHPLTQNEFADLKNVAKLNKNKFNQHFVQAISPHWKQLQIDWHLFIGEIDFGFDIAAGALGNAKRVEKNKFAVSTTRSWQKTDVQVELGDQFDFNCRKRFQIALENETPLPCEANGITIEYYRGKPLGKLVVGILGSDGDVSGLFDETAIGLEQSVKFNRSGTLCIRINESPAKLFDNAGEVEIEIMTLENPN